MDFDKFFAMYKNNKWKYSFGGVKSFALFGYVLICKMYIVWPKQPKRWEVPAAVGSTNGSWCTNTLRMVSLHTDDHATLFNLDNLYLKSLN